MCNKPRIPIDAQTAPLEPPRHLVALTAPLEPVHVRTCNQIIKASGPRRSTRATGHKSHKASPQPGATDYGPRNERVNSVKEPPKTMAPLNNSNNGHRRHRQRRLYPSKRNRPHEPQSLSSSREQPKTLPTIKAQQAPRATIRETTTHQHGCPSLTDITVTLAPLEPSILTIDASWTSSPPQASPQPGATKDTPSQRPPRNTSSKEPTTHQLEQPQPGNTTIVPALFSVVAPSAPTKTPPWWRLPSVRHFQGCTATVHYFQGWQTIAYTPYQGYSTIVPTAFSASLFLFSPFNHGNHNGVFIHPIPPS